MPGIALIAQRAELAPAEFTRLLETMRRDRYESRTISAPPPSGGVALGTCAYPEYPITVIRDGDDVAVVEGGVYDPSPAQLAETMRDLLRRFREDAAAGREAAERWANGADGDFVVALLLADRGEALIVNDSLGRLELFITTAGGRCAIAREVKVLSAWREGELEPDRLGIAQTLLFGWPMLSRTLFEGISRIEPASSVLIDGATGSADVRQYRVWNVEAMQRRGRTRAAWVRELVPLLIDRCAAQHRWAASRPMLLSLSGGMDSRTVAAGFSAAGVRYDAVTFNDARREATDDANVAEQIARVLGVPWKFYQLEPPTWADNELLVEMRDGMNYIAASFVLPFLRALVADFGPAACYITGDGGSNLMPDRRGPRFIRTMDQWVEHRLSYSLWPIATVAALVGLPEATIEASVRAVFETYPERGGEYWGLRFWNMERGMRNALEGEERNRSILWAMTPLWSQSFFEQALSIPAEIKGRFVFYADFVRALRPELAEIPYANWMLPVNSLRGRARAFAEQAVLRLPPSVKSAIKRRMVPSSSDRTGLVEHRAEFERLRGSEAVRSVLADDALAQIAEHGCNRTQFSALMTVMMHLARTGGRRLASPVTV